MLKRMIASGPARGGAVHYTPYAAAPVMAQPVALLNQRSPRGKVQPALAVVLQPVRSGDQRRTPLRSPLGYHHESI